MESFLVKKDVNSVIWPYFIKWFTENIGDWYVVKEDHEYFGYISGKYTSEPTIGSFTTRTFLISLELWNLFYYSFNKIPQTFVVECDESHPDWQSFKDWFVKESGFALGNIKWNYLGRDNSIGSSGFNASQKASDFKSPITFIDIDTWKTARYSRIDFDKIPEKNTSKFKIGDIVCEEYNDIIIIDSIEVDHLYDKEGNYAIESRARLVNQYDLISLDELSDNQIDIILNTIDEFRNSNNNEV